MAPSQLQVRDYTKMSLRWQRASRRIVGGMLLALGLFGVIAIPIKVIA